MRKPRLCHLCQWQRSSDITISLPNQRAHEYRTTYIATTGACVLEFVAGLSCSTANVPAMLLEALLPYQARRNVQCPKLPTME